MLAANVFGDNSDRTQGFVKLSYCDARAERAQSHLRTGCIAILNSALEQFDSGMKKPLEMWRACRIMNLSAFRALCGGAGKADRAGWRWLADE